jgi:hypothetical protein
MSPGRLQFEHAIRRFVVFIHAFLCSKRADVSGVHPQMADFVVPGSILEDVVTPPKLAYVAYIAKFGDGDNDAICKWLVRALCVCKTSNTRYVSDVCRVACILRVGLPDDVTFGLEPYIIPDVGTGAVPVEEDADEVLAGVRSLSSGDTRGDVVTLNVYRFCKAYISDRFVFKRASYSEPEHELSQTVFKLLRAFSKDVTFTAHGDRYLHMFIKLISSSWASTVTQCREPAFKVAERQYGPLLNDMVRPLIDTSPSEQFDAMNPAIETKRAFSLVAGIMLI